MSNKKVKLIVGILVFVIFIGVVGFAYSKLSSEYKPDNLAQEGEQVKPSEFDGEAEKETEPEKFKAPDFTVTDMNGEPVKLSDFKGKPVVLNIWATWCGFCVKEMPDFEKVSKERKDIQFMMINLTGGGETVEKAKAFIEENGFTFPVFFDMNSEVYTAYDGSSVPATFFIDKDGNLVANARGMIDEETLLRGIGMIAEK